MVYASWSSDGLLRPEDPDYKSPVDVMIKEMHDKPNFSIILHDMDREKGIFKTYKHQYKVVLENERHLK